MPNSIETYRSNYGRNAFKEGWGNEKSIKQYLIKGYAINQQIKLERYNKLKDVVRLMSRTVNLQEKVISEEYG